VSELVGWLVTGFICSIFRCVYFMKYKENHLMIMCSMASAV